MGRNRALFQGPDRGRLHWSVRLGATPMSHLSLTRRAFIGATSFFACAPGVSRSSEQPDWEPLPEIRPTDTAASVELLRGQHYSLGPTVTTFAYMNRYTVASDYGPFVAPSDARLRRLIN